MSLGATLPTDFTFNIEGTQYRLRAEMDAFAGAPSLTCAVQGGGEWSYIMLIEASQKEVDKYGSVEGFMVYALTRINEQLNKLHPTAEPVSLLELLQAFLKTEVFLENDRLAVR